MVSVVIKGVKDAPVGYGLIMFQTCVKKISLTPLQHQQQGGFIIAVHLANFVLCKNNNK